MAKNNFQHMAFAMYWISLKCCFQFTLCFVCLKAEKSFFSSHCIAHYVLRTPAGKTCQSDLFFSLVLNLRRDLREHALDSESMVNYAAILCARDPNRPSVWLFFSSCHKKGQSYYRQRHQVAWNNLGEKFSAAYTFIERHIWWKSIRWIRSKIFPPVWFYLFVCLSIIELIAFFLGQVRPLRRVKTFIWMASKLIGCNMSITDSQWIEGNKKEIIIVIKLTRVFEKLRVKCDVWRKVVRCFKTLGLVK